MQKQWITPTDDRPLTVETLLTRRGITGAVQIDAFLHPAHYTPAPPTDLPDMARAVERIERAIKNGERILIWGDFDVDGQTATSLLVESLASLGAQVTHYIPHRDTEGHGIQPERLAALLDERRASLVLTCDTGIAAHAAVEAANRRGVDVIITDHHQLPDTLPPAYAAVNPQRVPSDHPLHSLPGVGAAYKLVEALYTRAGRGADALEPLLDLVALGIVADVAVLVNDTRYLLQRGLDVLRTTQRPGLQAMMQLANIDPAHLTETDIGFGIGPRMNALGRLDDANQAVELLTTHDTERAQILANTLEGLNSERKNMSTQVLEGAEKQITADPALLDNYSVLLLHNEHWPGGIVGIVANRLAERYDRPVILMREDAVGVLRGSARSVAGVDITAAIAAHSEHLLGYGGHTMAAGLSLHKDDLPAFHRGLSNTVREMRKAAGQVETALRIDALIPFADVDLALVDALRKLAPFGPGNPPVIVATPKLTLKDNRQLGRDGKHRKLIVEDENGDTGEILWWNATPDDLPPGRFDAAYTISDNIWKDQRRLQLELVDIRPVDEEPLTYEARVDVAIIDHRAADNHAARLRDVLDAHPDALIWSEGGVKLPHGTGQRRHQLKPAQTLVIWTAPPHPDILRTALERVNPARVALFYLDPGWDSLKDYVARLRGLVEYALNREQGAAHIERMAGALAARLESVRFGLDYMATHGKITITHRGEDICTIRAGGIPDAAQQAPTQAKLESVLNETASYRKYARSAAAESLLAK